MFELLLKSAVEIAKKLGEDRVFVVSNSYVDEELIQDIKVVVAPRKYSTFLESIVFSFEKEYDLEKLLGMEFIEKTMLGHHTSEYISSLAYLKNIPFSENFIVVVDLDSYKSVLILNPKKSRIYKAIVECSERVDSEVMRAVLNVALSIATKGREGRSIGTGFVIGDVKEVLRRSRQLILNPFEGHEREVRNIKDPFIWESIREFAQLDGVFIIDEDGIIVSAGRYLEASVGNLKIKPGLGGRHIACAAISQETEAIAVVVSESGGDIAIFKDGNEILRISSLFM
jgi:DNA integrity scanning protein DisA with diadenylate cyclase activity